LIYPAQETRDRLSYPQSAGIPAKAGIQVITTEPLDSRLRGNDRTADRTA